jgi:hypothetical protein
MADRIIPETSASADWPRLVAQVVNKHSKDIAALPFSKLATAPADPVEGQTYYDTALHKMRTWDGSAWQNHW